MIIVGASGQGKVVLSTALALGLSVKGFLDDYLVLGSQVNRYNILGKVNDLRKGLYSTTILGIGSNIIRKKLAETYDDFTSYQTLIHPFSYIDPTAVIGEGTVIFAGSVIQANVVIGKHCIINTGVSIDHDCHVGDFSHLAPGVNVPGNVHIGKGVFIGVGSAMIPGIQIGDWAFVAAGSVVVNPVGANSRVMGVPAAIK